MNCKELINLMDGYLDGELDALTNQNIEQHLRDCSGCDQAYKEHQALFGAIKAAAPYHKAPESLREQIQSSLRAEVTERPARNTVRGNHPQVVRKQAEPWIPFEWSWNWLGVAAALLLAAIAAWNLPPMLRRPDAEQFLATQLVASHVRSLMVNHLTDVASSDQHTVKPWFDGKLDFAPAVADLASDGFPLLGGRLDYLDNRPVAALVYQRRKHFINVFIWPVEPGSSTNTKPMTRQGYQLLHWVESDLNYWAVSDVSENELLALRQLIQKQTAPR